MTNGKVSWTEGFSLKIPAAAVLEEIEQLPEPSPEALLDASEDPDHILHAELWQSNKDWARIGRLDFCGRILRSIKIERVERSVTVTVRAIEYSSASKMWKTFDEIAANPDDRAALISAVIDAAEQFGSKLVRLRTLFPNDGDVSAAVEQHDRTRKALVRVSERAEAPETV